ncbi:MAG TPA: hypothetical protein PLK12_13220 [Prolixibacteraceae bacterium]|nr:hypothetical protein [Prolixibacteraceae bacterium]
MNNKPITIFFQGVSFLFNPFLIPTLGLWVLYHQIPGTEFYSSKVRLILFLIYFLSTCFFPLLFIVLYAVSPGGKRNLDHHRDRIVPYLFTAFSVFLGAQLTDRLPLPGIFRIFLLGISLIVVLSLLISLRWKISGHLSAIGGLTGVLIGMNFRFGMELTGWIIGAIVVSGLLGSARIFLGKHSPAQVYAGYALGLACMLLLFSLI